MRAGDEIRKQINLPWPKATQIALNSLKIRFWRSMITAAGIFLGVAFLCFSLTQLLVGHMRPGSDEYNRQIWLVTMALLVCLVGIMNAMLMSVSERFREIGTMKCLGALDALVVRLFIIEAVFMGIIASVAGWLLGFVAVFLVRCATLGWAGAVHGLTGGVVLEIFGACVGVGAVITLVAALWPAMRAARMPPAAALRTTV